MLWRRDLLRIAEYPKRVLLRQRRGKEVYKSLIWISKNIKIMLKKLKRFFWYIVKIMKWFFFPIWLFFHFFYMFLGLNKIIIFLAYFLECVYIVIYEICCIFYTKGVYWFKFLFKGAAYVASPVRRAQVRAQRKERYRLWRVGKAIASKVDVVNWVISK